MNEPNPIGRARRSDERTAYLSLGSNIQPVRHLLRCLASLRKLPASNLIACSSWYRTAAWGGATSDDFVNLVVALETRLSAHVMLEQTGRIEARLGRQRKIRYGARTIDVDLLLIGREIHTGPELTVPHPGLTERDFMLIPLLEIAPRLCDPRNGRLLSESSDRLLHRQIIARFPNAQAVKGIRGTRD